MKKLLLLALLGVSLPALSQTQMVRTSDSATVFVNTACVNGWLFAVATVGKTNSSNGSGGVALTQIFRRGPNNDHPPQPIECKPPVTQQIPK